MQGFSNKRMKEFKSLKERKMSRKKKDLRERQKHNELKIDFLKQIVLAVVV
jgi:hypothetical protein